MKNIKLFQYFLLSGFMFLTGCPKDEMEINTEEPISIKTTSAEVFINIVYIGDGINQYGHCYSKTPHPTVFDKRTELGAATKDGRFKSTLVGLEPGMTYYVRSYASNKNITKYGNEVPFTTDTISIPKITTSKPRSITATNAISGGDVTSDGGFPLLARGVCWSNSANPTIKDRCSNDGSKTGIFTSSITPLIPLTTYYVSAYATNKLGTNYGHEFSFTTDSLGPPEVTTWPLPLSITATSAICSGTVTSDGGSPVTAKGICWSTSINPSIQNAKCNNEGPGSGNFSSNLTSLTPSTTYYYRAYATNIIDTSYGLVLNFTTKTK